jgi:hypothetical protein
MFLKRKPYKVKLKGRASLLYEEQGKTLSVDSELLGGANFDIVIYSDSIKNWDPPFETEVLSDADKQRIKANITEDLPRLRIDWA